MDKLEILKKYWNYDHFRPQQAAIIDKILAHQDGLSILATGQGKSICYQVPALILEGVCVVISPLIALINDQIEQLKSRSIAATTLPSGSSNDDIIRIFDNIQNQKIPFLYLSPERLQQDLVINSLKRLQISFFAIDEAHCITEWGHDFRPSYLRLNLLKVQFPNITIAAFTATATKNTQSAIISQLQLKSPYLFTSNFIRPNIRIKFYETNQKTDLLNKILHLIKGPKIIYVKTRQDTHELAQELTHLKHRCSIFHAGLTKDEKDKSFENWNAEQTNIMIATTAFGMGIDKSNVRLVAHLDIPNNLESYIQEFGRAGRDGETAFSCVIVTNNDLVKFKNQLNQHQPTFKGLEKVYLALQQYYQISVGETNEATHDFDLDLLCNRYQLKKDVTKEYLIQLHNFNILQLQQNYNTNSISAQFTATPQQVIQNLLHKNITEYLIRHYVGIFEKGQKINLIKAANDLNLHVSELEKALDFLESQQLIKLTKTKEGLSITFKYPREDKYTLAPIQKNITSLYQYNKYKKEQVLAFFEQTKLCRNIFISDYFGEYNEKPCNTCDICVKNNSKTDLKGLFKEIKESLLEKPKTYNDLLLTLNTNALVLKEALQFLIHEEIILLHNFHYQII